MLWMCHDVKAELDPQHKLFCWQPSALQATAATGDNDFELLEFLKCKLSTIPHEKKITCMYCATACAV